MRQIFNISKDKKKAKVELRFSKKKPRRQHCWVVNIKPPFLYFCGFSITYLAIRLIKDVKIVARGAKSFAPFFCLSFDHLPLECLNFLKLEISLKGQEVYFCVSRIAYFHSQNHSKKEIFFIKLCSFKGVLFFFLFHLFNRRVHQILKKEKKKELFRRIKSWKTVTLELIRVEERKKKKGWGKKDDDNKKNNFLRNKNRTSTMFTNDETDNLSC